MTECNSPEPCSGRDQLLEAAGQVFAETGYKQATVREIVKRAGASLGAVNYHFRDKAGLYGEVLRLAHERTIAEFREAVQVPDPEQRLRRFVRVGLSHALGEDPAWTWTGQVLAAELLSMNDDNRRALFEQFIVPRQVLLFAILRDLMPAGVDDDVVRRHAISLIGQCVMYFICRHAVEATYGRRLGEADLDWISQHITHVALAGIRAEAG